MYKTNYHTHTTFCDGKQSLEQMILHAIEKQFTALGFSSHAMYPFASTWHIPLHQYESYCKEIELLKQKYTDEIEIFLGFEADFFPSLSHPDKKIYAPYKIDYLIGSAHYIVGNPNFPCFTADGRAQEVQKGIIQHFNGNVKAFVQTYFQNVRTMIQNYDFDIIGHLDVIRKRNKELQFLDETERWYKNEIQQTAELIGTTHKRVEINTGGIARNAIDDTYPSVDFLTYLYKNKVPIVINSDAHAANHLDCAFDFAKKNARKAGYSSIEILTRENNAISWKQIDLADFGI